MENGEISINFRIPDHDAAQTWHQGTFEIANHSSTEGAFRISQGAINPTFFINSGHLDHPAIARIPFMAQIDSRAIYGFEKFECSLGDWLNNLSYDYRAEYTLDQRVKSVIRYIISGLQHAHERGMSGVDLDIEAIIMVRGMPKLTRVNGDATNGGISDDYARLGQLIRFICGVGLCSRDDITDLLFLLSNPFGDNARVIRDHPAFWSDMKCFNFIMGISVYNILSDTYKPQIEAALNSISWPRNKNIYHLMRAAKIPFFNEIQKLRPYQNTAKDCLRFCRNVYIHIEDGLKAGVGSEFSTDWVTQKLFEFFPQLILRLHQELIRNNVLNVERM